MRVKILGGSGANIAWAHSGCLLIDDHLALDSGGLASQLSFSEQAAIDHVVLTHAHLDHIGELAFLADNVMTLRSAPLKIWAPEPVIAQVRQHLFNNQIWPDFSKIRLGEHPVIEFCELAIDEPCSFGKLTFRWARTSHPVFSAGYLLDSAHGSILYTGDTGPTEEIWKLANQAQDLRAVFVETALPNRLQNLALVSGHLTPALLCQELEKLRDHNPTINIMHVKPAYLEEISTQLKGIQRPWRIITGGELTVLEK